MKPRARVPTTRSTGKETFHFLLVTAWVCVGALAKWNARWLYPLLGLTVIAALWAGRRQPALLRALLLLALVFPAWKLVDRRPNRVEARENSAVIGDDAALISALVGPHYVQWNQYRGDIEARMSRMTGLDVRITGPVEARLLPTPSLTLQGIEVSRPGDVGALEARSLDVEFALGALVRGEWRASHVRLEGAQIEAGLDSAGRLDWSAPAMTLDPDTISIEQLDVVNRERRTASWDRSPRVPIACLSDDPH